MAVCRKVYQTWRNLVAKAVNSWIKPKLRLLENFSKLQYILQKWYVGSCLKRQVNPPKNILPLMVYCFSWMQGICRENVHLALENVKRAKELVSECPDEVGFFTHSSQSQKNYFKVQRVEVDVSNDLNPFLSSLKVQVKFGTGIEDEWFSHPGFVFGNVVLQLWSEVFSREEIWSVCRMAEESFDLSKVGGCSRENQVVASVQVASEGNMHAWVFQCLIRPQYG